MVKRIQDDGAAVALSGASTVHADPMHMTSSSCTLIDIPVGFKFNHEDDEDVQGVLSQITVVREKWTAPNYDKMSLEEFTQLLEGETYSAAMGRKRLHDIDNKQESGARGEPYLDGDGNGLTFAEMCNRVATRLQGGAVAMVKVSLPAPEIESSGSKYRIIKNFGHICTAIGRAKEDVMEFLRVELQPDKASINDQEQLSLKISQLKVDRFSRAIFRYIDLYVECKACRSILTTMTKDGVRMKVTCTRCKADRFAEQTKDAKLLATKSRKK